MTREDAAVPSDGRGSTWWLRLWGGVAVVGGLCTVLVLGPGPALGGFVCGSLGVCCGICVLRNGDISPFREWTWDQVAARAAVVGCVLPAVSGLGRLSLTATVWLMLVAALTHPGLWSTVRSRIPDNSRAAGAAPGQTLAGHPRLQHTSPCRGRGIEAFLDPAASARQAADMSIAELCRAWRRSYLAPDAAVDPFETLLAVQARQTFLDELCRRHHRRISAWFEAGGRAASGPEKFLIGDDETA